jgi:tape measure domain-containing protein
LSKTLNASVKLNTTDAENKLKRLAASISYINKAINGKSTNALEASLDKQLIAAQKVRKATADAEAAELRLAAAKGKQAQAAQKKVDAELRAAEQQIALERNLMQQQQQATWKKFQAEQAAYEQSVQQAKQAEAEKAKQRAIFDEQKVQREKINNARIRQEAMTQLMREQKAKEKAAKKAAEQERKLREKQHKEELRRIEKELKARKQLEKEVNSKILGAVKSALGAYFGVMGLQVVINTSDVITSAENKLNHINGGDTNATKEQMDTMYAASQRSRMKYSDMMSNTAKSMTLAPDAFKDDINNAIRFQEIMAKSYTLAGASDAEMSSSMYQLIQGLGSGILQGDELRSVREGAPLAYKAIEEYAQGVLAAAEAEKGLKAGALGSTAALKDLAADGVITSEMVVAAIMKSGEAVDEAFKNTKMTFAQAKVMIQNTATKAFEPALQKINEALNSLAETGFFDTIATGLTIIGKIAYSIASAFNFIAEHWKIAQTFILPLVALLGVLCMQLISTAVAQSVVAFWNKLIEYTGKKAWYAMITPIGWVIIAIVAVIAALNACGVSFSDMAGYAVGVILWLVSVIWNAVIGVINAIIQFVWNSFANPLISIVEWILNVCTGGFDSFGEAVFNLLGQIISGFLSLGKVVTKIIDAIFGTNWTDGLNRVQNMVLSYGKNDKAITISREAPTIQSLTGGAVDRWASKDAYNTGFNWASNGVNSIGKNLTNWDEKIGIGNAGAFDDVAANTGDTAGNTGKMADSMELAAEDLELLYDLAEMEWKKEFTTANITVDMSNYNTFNDTSDWEGFAKKLYNGLVDEVNASANGVYAF